MKKLLIPLLTAATLSLTSISTVLADQRQLSNITVQIGDDFEENEISFASPDDTIGQADSNDQMEKIPVYTAKNLNFSYTAGPFVITYKNLQVSNVTVKDESLLNLLGVESSSFALVVIDQEIECTSEDKHHFNPNLTKLVSSTKEQVDANYALSDYIDTDFLGNVIQTASTFFTLEKSDANGIESIKLFVNPPSDSDLNYVCDDIVIEFTFADSK